MSARRYRALDTALAHGLLPDPVLRLGSRWGIRTRQRRSWPAAWRPRTCG